MKKKFILLILAFLLFQNNYSYAEEQLSTKNIEKFYTSLKSPIITYNDKIKKLKSLSEQLSKALENQNLSIYNRKFLNDYYKTTNEKIFSLNYENDLKQDAQKTLELKKLNELKNSIIIPNKSSYIYNLVSNNRKLITSNNTYEFVEGESIKRIDFTKAFILTPDVINQFKSNKGIILSISGTDKNYFIEDYKIEEKIPYSKLGKYTKGFFTTRTQFYQEGSIYYGYVYENFKFFEDPYGLYLNALGNFGDISKYLLYKKDDGKYVFVVDFKKVKLINADIIYGIPGKFNFLNEVLNDIAPPGTKLTDTIIDASESYKKLKNETQTLVKGLKKEDKIKKIYAWILDNISYTKVIDFENAKIFSGILTYNNKDGVCTGYTKLFLFMLNFAGIDDAEVIRGNVIDAQDFPSVGHAWIKMGDYYYDPTFDDPVGNTITKTYEQYKFYKLPKDLFYTNRYNYSDTPESLKTTDIDYRKEIVKKNLSTLSEKYKKNNYVLLKPYIFKQKYGYKYNENITLENISKIKPIYKVVNNYLEKDGQKKFITNIFYYTLNNNDDIETFLEQFDYNIDEYTFLDWDLGNGKKELRVARNLKF